MSKALITESILSDTADAIRGKLGTQNAYYPSDFPDAIASISGGLTYETGTYTPTADVTRPSIGWANSHTEAPILVAMCDVSDASGITTNSSILFCYYDPYKIFDKARFPYSTTSYRYAVAYFSYKTSNSVSSSGITITNNSDNTGQTSSSYPRYWASPTDFHPYTNSSSRYWRANRTYKWIAIWK